MTPSGVSVALCTYDGERWLPAFLDGLLAQTRPPVELVVSDDGSRDRTLDLIRDFAAVSPFPVRVSSTPRRLGSTFNFEIAFGACTGDLIAPADQDDVWAPRKLEQMATAMEARGLAMGFSDGTVIDAFGRPVATTLWKGVGFGSREQRAFAHDPLGLLLRRSVVTGAAMMFRSRYLDRLLPFPGVLNGPGSLMLHDRWIALVLAAVADVGAVAEPLIAFRRHVGQQTGLREPLSTGEVAHQLRRSTASAAEGLRTRAAQLAVVRSRLDGDAHPGADDRLATAVAHLQSRASLPAARAARVPIVLQEWVRGRYRYSTGGARSAVADLARPAPEAPPGDGTPLDGPLP